MKPTMLESVRRKALEIWREHDLLSDPVTVKAKTLTVREVLGDPEGDDFPIQKGKEQLMEADFRGAKGQAFTDRYGDFCGTLAEVAGAPLENNFRRAVFVATFNASMRWLGLCDRTVHCRNKELAECAALLCDHIEARYGNVRIAQVGYQPKIIEALSRRFDVKVLDLDPDNIGAIRHGAEILGPKRADEVQQWAQLLVVTGSTLANGTIDRFLTDKPVIFYGTTIAAAASVMGWERFCARAH